MLERNIVKGKILIFISAAFVLLVIIPYSGLSISFGAFPKKDIINIQQGGVGSFEILFYSRSEESPHFYLSAKDYPKNFIITYPESFDLNSGFLDEEYVLISGEYIKAKIVKVDVSVPITAKIGEYKILLNAIVSEGRDKSINSLNVKSEKTFLLRVNVIENSAETTGKIKSVGGLEVESESENFENNLVKNFTDERKKEYNKLDNYDTITRREKTPYNNIIRPIRYVTGLASYIYENKILLLIISTTLVTLIIALVYRKKSFITNVKIADSEEVKWNKLKEKWSKYKE